MSERRKERVWILQTTDDSPTCEACESDLTIGDEVAECPRCKALHHLSCWVERGGCARLGCPQKADPSLTKDVPRSYDPPARDTLSWVPAALTVTLIVLLIGGGLWAFFNKSASEGNIIVMMTTGPDVQAVQALATDFAAAHDDLEVNVLILPADAMEMYEQKLVIMLAAKDPPDIVFLPLDRFADYAAQGALTSLEVMRELFTEDSDHRLAGGEYEGRLYGLPHPTQQTVLSIPVGSHNLIQSMGLLLSIVQGLAVAEPTE